MIHLVSSWVEFGNSRRLLQGVRRVVTQNKKIKNMKQVWESQWGKVTIFGKLPSVWRQNIRLWSALESLIDLLINEEIYKKKKREKKAIESRHGGDQSYPHLGREKAFSALGLVVHEHGKLDTFWMRNSKPPFGFFTFYNSFPASSCSHKLFQTISNVGPVVQRSLAALGSRDRFSTPPSSPNYKMPEMMNK